MEQLASRGFVGGHARLSNRSAIHSRPASGRGRRGSVSSFGIRISNTMPRYDAQRIEPKWQAYWDQHQPFATGPFDPAKEKLYVLDMFPYPSGAGLHVGHPEGYTATDIVCRYVRMRGKQVLHPMGFDSFGLPAEEYAIKTGTHPANT